MEWQKGELTDVEGQSIQLLLQKRLLAGAARLRDQRAAFALLRVLVDGRALGGALDAGGAHQSHDDARLGVHAHRSHDHLAAALHHVRAGEKDGIAVGRLLHVVRLAGQRGLVQPEVVRLDDHAVGGQEVACREKSEGIEQERTDRI